MLKYVLRNTLLYAAGLYIVPFILPGLYVKGGITTYLIAGLILMVLNRTIVPLLNLITLPIQLVSFGLFSFVVNAFILYVLTVIMPQITISAFQFSGFTVGGFIIPKIDFNTLFAYIVSSIALTLFVNFIKWLHEVHL